MTIVLALLARVPVVAWEALCAGLAVLLLVCSVQLGITRMHLASTRAALATQTAAWATERAALSDAARIATDRARQVELQRAADTQIAQEKHDALETRARAAAVLSAGHLDRLQHALQIAAAALRRGTPGDPATAGEREAGATAADLLGRCAQRYRDLGQQADSAYASGQQCQQIHDALIQEQ